MAGKAPVIPNAVMLDRVMAEIQDGLVQELPWLDVAFGRSQKLTKVIENKRYVIPNVYCGGWNGHGYNDYIEVTPDSKIGNYSFFDIEDPQTLVGEVWGRDLKAPFSLIFWFDLRTIYHQNDNRNIEKVKADILKVLNGRTSWHLPIGRITINKIYEKAENVYRGYTLYTRELNKGLSIPEENNQYMMHPYCALRFEGTMEVPELCE